MPQILPRFCLFPNAVSLPFSLVPFLDHMLLRSRQSGLIAEPAGATRMPNLRGRPTRLTPEERKSLTHGDFWIPDEEREVYRRALEAVNAANVTYVIAGAYAIYDYTGIYRKTKDLDLFFEPSSVVAAAQ